MRTITTLGWWGDGLVVEDAAGGPTGEDGDPIGGLTTGPWLWRLGTEVTETETGAITESRVQDQ